MPRAGYTKRTYTGPRPWEITDAAPFSDVPDLARGETRLAAEVALAHLRGMFVPESAYQRATSILKVLATG